MDKKSLQPLLEKAKNHEKRYYWLEAADFYQQAINQVSEDILTAAKLQKQIGFCFFKAAMQANTNEIFRDRMGLAIKAYKERSKLIQSVEKNEKCAKISHAKALVTYASSLLERDRAKKGKLLDEWWKLEKAALEEYEKAGDLINIGKTCNNLIQFSPDYRTWLPTDFQDIKRMMNELINLGEKAIKSLSGLDNDYELARAYCYTGLNYSVAVWWIGGNKHIVKEIKQKSIEYSKKALMHSEKIADSYLITRSHLTESALQFFIKDNIIIANEHAKKALEYAKITKDKLLLAQVTSMLGTGSASLNLLEEDPEKRKEGIRKSIKVMQESIDYFQIISSYGGRIFRNYKVIITSLKDLAQSETNIKSRTEILNKAVEVGYEGIKYTEGYAERRTVQAFSALIEALYTRAMVETNSRKKQRLLQESLEYCIKENKILKRVNASIKLDIVENIRNQVFIYAELAKVEQKKEKKIELLTSCLAPMKNAIKFITKDNQVNHLSWISNHYGRFCYRFATPLNELYILTKDIKIFNKFIEVYKSSVESYNIADTRSRVAEAYWQMAKIYDHLDDRLESAKNYQLASQNYKLAAKKIPQLKEFYNNYSLYMRAWSQIEQARHSHSVEDYEDASQYYKKSAELHKFTSSWNYLASNYFAWGKMEEAEGLSRKENTKQAKQIFQKALNYFCNSKESFKQKIQEISSADEKKMAQRLFDASNLRQRYCQARILMEEAKLLDREGKYLQSTKKYSEAAQKFSAIADKVHVEVERNELKYLTILCRAWEKMANAEETTSSKSYLLAAELFEKAREYCYTKKASLWALGNSNFCKGLAAGLQYRTNLDLANHAKAKGYIKNASINYMQAGFKNASEYAKATQRLFDAYVFINRAEGEFSQEKKVKHYRLAENLLQLAAGSFVKSKQVEKRSLVLQILEGVREDKELAISFDEVLHAPSVASTTSSFAAPTSTSETSVGLEQFEHSNIQANLISKIKKAKVGESFSLSVEFVNVGREPALLMRVEDFISPDFVVVEKPEIFRIEDACLNMKGKQILPLKLVEVKVVLQPTKKGIYTIQPTLNYFDERGKSKILQLKSLEIKVEEVILEDRISTGTKDLDSLLLGGVPKEYAVLLSGSPSDEREYLIKNFLQEGANKKQTTFYVTTDAQNIENLLDKTIFYVFLCNPKPKTPIPDQPNIVKVRSKTDLNNLNMAIARTSRNIQEKSEINRVCIENISDVLLRNGPEITRRWLSELTTDLVSKGFTILAVIDPMMHPQDQLYAVLNLFDGEIAIIQSDDPLDCKKSVQVKKLRGKDYIKNPICLTKQ